MFIPDIDWLCGVALKHAKSNDLAGVQYCLAYGADASETDEDGRNAVHHMALHANFDALDFLAADDILHFYRADNNGVTPLMLLAEAGHGAYLAQLYAEHPTIKLTAHPEAQQTVAGFLAASGYAELVVNTLLPKCDDIRHERVIAQVMQSTTLKPTEKMKAVRLLSQAGFSSVM